MVCVKVIGNHTGITLAGSQGQFQTNVLEPLIAHNILQSIDLLSDSSKNFLNIVSRVLERILRKLKMI